MMIIHYTKAALGITNVHFPASYVTVWKIEKISVCQILRKIDSHESQQQIAKFVAFETSKVHCMKLQMCQTVISRNFCVTQKFMNFYIVLCPVALNISGKIFSVFIAHSRVLSTLSETLCPIGFRQKLYFCFSTQTEYISNIVNEITYT